jgi:hypothetical protein
MILRQPITILIPRLRPHSAEDSKIERTKERTVSRSSNTSRLAELIGSKRLRTQESQKAFNHTPRPFVVKRWRLDESDDASCGFASSATQGTLHPCVVRQMPQSQASTFTSPLENRGFLQALQPTDPCSERTTLTPPSLVFPLSTDHLLHLVQFNVFRAFVSNKRTLNVLLTGWTGTPSSPTTCPIGGPYRDDTMVYPLNPNIPLCLRPTQLQQTRLHSLWINLIPFPRVRDNLIRHEGKYDHWELLQDLIGSLINFTPSQEQRRTLYSFTVTDPKPDGPLLAADCDEDEVTAGRNGLIVWGEPFDMHSWEATPAFLEKWAWAVQGCYELFESSNRWRRMRGEEPMRFSDLDPGSSCPTEHR